MNNSEILFLYDAQLSNPNGDPDDENRPRMDYQGHRNLVSDVRLKRYVRDYLQDLGHELYVARPDQGKTVTADQRLQNLLGHRATTNDLPTILERLIDVRLFGATMPIRGQGATGSSIQVTGPVQFSWGYSLNQVDLVSSSTITSRFGSTENKTTGTFGKDYRVYYSLIAFAGVVSGNRARISHLTEADLGLLDTAVVQAIPLQTTRSKIGQYPRLYMRIEYHDDQTMLGDWREGLKLAAKDNLRSTSDVHIDLNDLLETIRAEHQRITNVYLWMDPKLSVNWESRTPGASFHDALEEIIPGVVTLVGRD